MIRSVRTVQSLPAPICLGETVPKAVFLEPESLFSLHPRGGLLRHIKVEEHRLTLGGLRCPKHRAICSSRKVSK
jgi:hypothetical protein